MSLKKISIFLIVALTTLTINAQKVQLIPEPSSLQIGNGKFNLPNQISIQVPSVFEAIGTEMITRFKTVTGRNASLSNQKNATIRFEQVQDNSLGKEGYQLTVNEKGILVKAQTYAGALYAWQSILQLCPPAIYSNQVQQKITWSLPFVQITDTPRFEWRGFMMDVSRHFFTVAEVKKMMDEMAMYKLNRLHFHLTDDQGWRIEIKALPKLTQVGAWRPNRIGKWHNITKPASEEPKTYGGFYTQEEIKDLVAYAKTKNIEIMPEIDVPGHSMAFLAAYPQLSTTPNYPYQVNAGEEFIDWSGLNGHITARIDNNLDPSKKEVYKYLDIIFGELATLFPFEYMHMGGDETAKNNWAKSDDIKALMQRENLKTQDEVQSYFVRRVEKIMQSKGKKLMGWDEILEGGLAPEAAVMSWRGVKGGAEAARQKHPVVMSPSTHNYLDYYQGEATAEGSVYAGLRMKKTYSFEPVPEGVEEKYILGNQGNLWSEQLQNIRNLEYMAWPRLMAIAEVAWSPKQSKDWERFSKKVESHFAILDTLKIKYAKSIYDPIVTTTLNTKGELYAHMEGEVNGLDFYYTIDESMPDAYSNHFNGPILIPEDVTILRVISYQNGKPIGKLLNIPIAALKQRAVKVL
ncbi:MAG: beta-N-acetylhexosaminidase [Sediminibacterium sp.]